MKGLVVFVEGAADGWYVLRALGQLAGASLDHRKPADLPTPFGKSSGQAGQSHRGVILSWHDRAPLDRTLAASSEGHEPVFQAVATIPARPPGRAYAQMVFIVRMGGDRKHDAVSTLASTLHATFGPGLIHDIKQLALAFVFDADTPEHYGQNLGDCVQLREGRFSTDYPTLVGHAALRHGIWQRVGPGPCGLFVLHDAATRSGTLEDVVKPTLMTNGVWTPRLVAADTFLQNHGQAGDEVMSKASARSKANLTIAGQFANPGGSLAQILKRGEPSLPPGVPNEVFRSPAAQELVTFLTNIPWP